MERVTFVIRGCFSATASDGRDITPKSKKAVGLLALLLTCEGHKRNRRWVEDKLWSDRGPDQARGSLRQTLCDIRKALGDHAHILGSDRNAVWLVPEQIAHDLDWDQQDSHGPREFLEGLDIADPEFNDWLIEQRQAYPHHISQAQASEAPEMAPPNRRRIRIQCGLPWARKIRGSVFAQIVDDQVGKILSEFMVKSKCSTREQNADLIVRTSVHEEFGGSAVHVQVIDPMLDEIIHSDHCFTGELNKFMNSQEALGRLCWNVADRALEKLPLMRHGDDPVSMRAAFSQNSLRAVLSFEEERMQQSLIILDRALEYLEDGLFLSLQAWAKTSLIMEEFEAETPELQSEIKALLRRALEVSPDDPMVNAICANVKTILFADASSAIPAAQRALRDNPNNLFALQAMSTIRALQGDFKLAYTISSRGKSISSLTKFESMCNLHHALLCLNMQNTEEAMQSAQIAAECAPNYRAPRRQMLALHAINKEPAKVRAIVEELQQIEPEFSVARFLFDRAYPTNTLRKTGYLERASTNLSEVVEVN